MVTEVKTQTASYPGGAKRFLSIVSDVSLAVPKRWSSLLVLSGVHIVVKDGLFRVEATDLSIFLAAQFTAQRTADALDVIADKQRLIDALKNFGDTTGTIYFSVNGRVLQMRMGDKQLSVPMLVDSGEDFPPTPIFDEVTCAFALDGASMHEVLGRVVTALPKDDSRPILMAVNLQQAGDDLVFAATDGFRLAVSKRRNEHYDARGTEFNINLPGANAKLIDRLLETGKGKTPNTSAYMQLNPARTHACVQGLRNGVTAIVRLIDGQFPDYAQLVPALDSEASTVTLTVSDQAELIDALKLHRKHIDKGIVRLVLGDGTLQVTAKDIDTVPLFDDTFSVESHGPGGKIAFNASYFIDALASFGGEGSITIQVRAPQLSALLFDPGQRNTVTIMPIVPPR